MPIVIRCNRCGEEDDDPSMFETGPALADGWINADGTILCDACNHSFRAFVAGEAIAPIVKKGLNR